MPLYSLQNFTKILLFLSIISFIGTSNNLAAMRAKEDTKIFTGASMSIGKAEFAEFLKKLKDFPRDIDDAKDLEIFIRSSFNKAIENEADQIVLYILRESAYSKLLDLNSLRFSSLIISGKLLRALLPTNKDNFVLDKTTLSMMTALSYISELKTKKEKAECTKRATALRNIRRGDLDFMNR